MKDFDDLQFKTEKCIFIAQILGATKERTCKHDGMEDVKMETGVNIDGVCCRKSPTLSEMREQMRNIYII